MSDDSEDREEIPDVGGRDPGETPTDHDPTNGRWLEGQFADALETWGYLTARNEQLFGLETDVLARRQSPRNEPDDFIVGECKDWHTTLVGRDAVAAISHRAALARAMPVLVVARGVTSSAWRLAQQLDVRILTIEDLEKDGLPPLTEHRPPVGTFRTRREPSVRELREHVPSMVIRQSTLDIEAPVFFAGGTSPCYVPDRTGNNEYVSAYDSDYEFD
ncbi:hypothetical protein PN419_09085 [Halorubrum ezzemoulense]|uniref:hypothetical protein n=1 Tax=Halorubrum ezzemoulense TaxID=337243 RepID=UPI00232B9390|nr:hypothetical protein [Halorubrum ezzemoulense]MDB9249160.1 hypothetical protein [Halorubrum ezzemoulense]MDB9259684.1 hypothetical protein [Halorubrum ezzemoulense]MDB9263149.1 hypothetical protein [Halorubrum ezzemoulense]MDB9266421.1 hypothetical protein [Halorubrum ezzemoulense]MDB9270045.1 hypothetical protein [Halorubrum ezzemoulense]